MPMLRHLAALRMCWGSSNLAAIAEACKLLRASNTPSACDLLRLRML